MKTERILAALLILASFLAAFALFLSPRTPILAGDSRGPVDIALFEVNGSISDGDLGEPFPSNQTEASKLIRLIKQAEKDGTKAILLKINSPGGTAAASQAVYAELMRIRKEGKIQIVASCGDMAASGAYYIAAASHRIMANPASAVGSIGVILYSTDVSGLLGKLGVRTTVIKSGPHKDILSPFRAPTSQEKGILQALIDDTYQQFLTDVAAGRRLPVATVKPVADGRIFTGKSAQTLRLVDDLGSYTDALRLAAKLAKVKGEPSVRNYTAVAFWERFLPKMEAMLPQGRLRWNKLPLAILE